MGTTHTRGSRLSSRPFYTTVLLISLLTAYSFLANTQVQHKLGSSRAATHNGASQLLRRSDQPECREVHDATDQCAFVKQYCVDDDAGLLPYLHLYYCNLSQAKPVAFAILVVWLGLLFTTIGIAASDFFSINLSTIATILGLSESLAGVTFLAFGNGSPDVFSTFAAMSSNSASMAVGELLGAASFITGVVAGSMALVREFRVDRRTYARDIGFFIVAVGFTMVFLADGHLRFWECCVMIGYYVLYVVTVVGWHWYTKRRNQRLRREGEARSHVYGVAGQSGDELAGEPYRDDPEDVDPRERRSGAQTPDLSALEHGPRIEVDGQEIGMDVGADDIEGEEEELERMVAAEVASSMRVLRTGAKRSHRGKTPIRPSLVGVLEFRSALAQLQRESNLQLDNFGGRRHSEHGLPRRSRRGTTDAIATSTYRARHTVSDFATGPSGRDRALSTGHTPVSSPMHISGGGHGGPETAGMQQPQAISVSRSSSPPLSHTVDGSLAPPPRSMPGGNDIAPVPRLHIPSRRSSYSDHSSPNTPFPHYTDSPMMLTPGVHSERPEFMLPGPAQCDASFPDLHPVPVQGRPVSWWPYNVLPPPHILLATLFPTLQGWREKTHWDRFVSMISVPSIFLLVITLPVVESETSEDASDAGTAVEGRSHVDVGHVALPISIEPDSIEPHGEWERYRRHTMQRSHSHVSPRTLSPNLISLENDETAVESATPSPAVHVAAAAKPISDTPSISNANDETSPWNRWLVCVQLFTGPLFSVFILWANMAEDWENPGKELLKLILYTLIVSLVLLSVLILFTSDRARPKYHYLLCFLGFVISIAWISTIAGEVVGVLKTFGVVLGISEALLGLTIFAAGNSVGDLIADITVARLGYPVMALSACFGGPMLNILLGIGIGGVLMMVEAANHGSKKHPNEPKHYGPYHIQIGGTLMISAITLLVMLVGLLIVVPMNKWILSRKIGWTLISLWVASTIINVVVELTGVWGEVA